MDSMVKQRAVSVHLLCGVPGAGKTTFARQLCARLGNARRFSLDEMMHQRHGADPAVENFSQTFAEIEAQVWLMAGVHIAAGKQVIIDGGYWTKRHRDNARNKAAQLGVPLNLYWLATDLELCRQRVLQRSQQVPTDSLYIDQNAFDLFSAQFEVPSTDEQARIIRNSGSADRI